MVSDAKSAGMGRSELRRATKLLSEYIDIFRIHLRTDNPDLPVDFEPLTVHLIPGATPQKAAARKYSQAHDAFFKDHFDDLVNAGCLIKLKTPSLWSSPAHAVKKGLHLDHFAGQLTCAL